MRVGKQAPLHSLMVPGGHRPQGARTSSFIQIKPNIYQRVLPAVLTLLNRVVLLREPEPLDFRAAAFSEANFQEKLLELSIKLGSNALISP